MFLDIMNEESEKALRTCGTKEELLGKVCVCLLNKERCESLYCEVYHTDSKNFDGLVEAYYLRDNVCSVWLDACVVERLGVTVDELYAAALRNNFQPEIICMEDILDELVEQFLDFFQHKSAVNMCIVTNKEKFRGAICAEDVSSKLAEFLEDDLYLLPSAIHEMIAVPYSCASVDNLIETVVWTNANEVIEEERLIDAVYKYSRDTNSYERVV